MPYAVVANLTIILEKSSNFILPLNITSPSNPTLANHPKAPYLPIPPIHTPILRMDAVRSAMDISKLIGRGPIYVIAASIVCMAIAICTSLYIYHGHDHKHEEFYEGKVYAKDDVVIDAVKSFNRNGREKVVCYRESHRNFYIFTLQLTLVIVALTTYTAITRVRLSRKLYQQNRSIEQQSQELAKKSNEILSSIRYAQRLQNALLPSTQQMSVLLPGMALYFQPRDVVSGDFYYIKEVAGHTIVCVGDCTGHGVPGAFLATLASQALDNIIARNHQTDPALILSELNRTFYQILHSDNRGATGDGLEISIVALDQAAGQATVAAAGQSVLLTAIDDTVEIKGERYTIGAEAEHTFTPHALSMLPGATLFQYSDGFADQFGGPDGRKFSRKKFRTLLEQVAATPATSGSDMLREAFITWRGEELQIDDVLVLGYQVG